MHVYEDELHFNTTDNRELLEILTDWAKKPYIAKLFKKYREKELGGCNGSMFQRLLAEVINDFNNSGFLHEKKENPLKKKVKIY
jgi:hypothetical protein